MDFTRFLNEAVRSHKRPEVLYDCLKQNVTNSQGICNADVGFIKKDFNTIKCLLHFC